MKFVRQMIAAACTAALLATTAPASAHAIWFAERARQLAMIYGVGADDLDMVKRLPLVKSVTGYAPDWAPLDTRLRVAGPLPVIESAAPVAAVAAIMDYGLWSKTPDGEWHNKGRDEVPGATIAEHNWKYAVHLARLPTSQVPLIAGHTLQLVPVGPTIPAKMGEPLKVRAFFQGKPLAGVSIVSDFVNDPDQAPTRTDADGTATIPIRNQGLNVLVAVFAGPADDKAKVDHVEYSASLSFVLPHAPE